MPANALLWARLTSPGLGEPGGPLQRRIAEIYSRDEPPFYKGFLRLDTTSDEVTITLHEVFGNLPATDRASSEATLGTETAGFHGPHTLTRGQTHAVSVDRCHASSVASRALPPQPQESICGYEADGNICSGQNNVLLL